MFDDSFLVERQRQAADKGEIPDAGEAFAAGLESQLVTSVREGDPTAFGHLFRRFWGGVLAQCAKYFSQGAEDLAQGIFMKIWTIRDRLDPSKSFEHFLRVVARNFCLDAIKKEAAKGPFGHDQLFEADNERLEELIDPRTLADEGLSRIRDSLTIALSQLTPVQRFVVEKVKDEIPTLEIAKELECTVVNVRYHKQKAFERLREILRPGQTKRKDFSNL